MKRLFVFSFLTVFAFIGNLICQDDSDLSVYFDDGGFTTSKNIVSINLASIIVDDVHFNYERKLSDMFSFEIGAGYLLPYYVRELNYWIFNDKVFDIKAKAKEGLCRGLDLCSFYVRTSFV